MIEYSRQDYTAALDHALLLVCVEIRLWIDAFERARNHGMFENLAGQVWIAPHSSQQVGVAAVLCNRKVVAIEQVIEEGASGGVGREGSVMTTWPHGTWWDAEDRKPACWAARGPRSSRLRSAVGHRCLTVPCSPLKPATLDGLDPPLPVAGAQPSMVTPVRRREPVLLDGTPRPAA